MDILVGLETTYPFPAFQESVGTITTATPTNIPGRHVVWAGPKRGTPVKMNRWDLQIIELKRKHHLNQTSIFEVPCSFSGVYMVSIHHLLGFKEGISWFFAGMNSFLWDVFQGYGRTNPENQNQ